LLTAMTTVTGAQKDGLEDNIAQSEVKLRST
jgi:hypothetical protein